MMHTEYALLMSMLWSDFVILLIYLLRQRLWFIRIFSVRVILILYCGCLFRLFVNAEIQSVYEISIPQLNFIGDLVNLQMGAAQVPMPKLLAAIWMFGSLLLLARLIITYIKSHRHCSLFPRNAYIEKYLVDIVEKRHCNRLSVITSSEIISPYVTGIFHSTICLPERKWEKKKLRIIIEHEYTHYKNHDLLTILLVDLFVISFWWNPPVYLLRSHVSEILEFKVDESVLKNRKSSDARFYCKTLIEFASKSSSRVTRGFAVSVIESRITRILDHRLSVIHQILFSAALLIVTFSTLVASYLFILQPAYQPSISDYTGTPLERATMTRDSNGEMHILFGDSEVILTENQKQILSIDETGD